MKTPLLIIFVCIVGLTFVYLAPRPVISASPTTNDYLVDIAMAIASISSDSPKQWKPYHWVIPGTTLAGDKYLMSVEALLTVPPGQSFVIRRLYVAPMFRQSQNWSLAADATTLVDGSINLASTGPGGHTYKFQHDFPDGCLVVDANETLNCVNGETSSISMTVLGYYE